MKKTGINCAIVAQIPNINLEPFSRLGLTGTKIGFESSITVKRCVGTFRLEVPKSGRSNWNPEPMENVRCDFEFIEMVG